jgi:uncharacterized protein YjbI with pentapeptide repeats
LWFSFLGLTLYFAIAALTTTHKDLLLGEPKTLPLLNIPVPLLPFYLIAPLIYCVFHFYLLVMLSLLACTAGEFEKQLRTTLPDDADHERYRARVENTLFLQLLVGMKRERVGFNGFLLGAIALITIVLAPLATLILMQLMFLPYHHYGIAWWHRVFVGADLTLIVALTYRCFFPRAPLVLGTRSNKPRWAMMMAFCIVLAVLLAGCLSFHWGHWSGEPTPSTFKEVLQRMVGTRPQLPGALSDNAVAVKGVVFERFFPARLELRDEAPVGKDKLDKTKNEIASRGGDFVPTIDLDYRDLQAADMYGADLRGVSLTATTLRGASLHLARLDGARLFNTEFQGADLTGAQLQGALLNGAQLQGADLRGAGLRGASLSSGELPHYKFKGARLQGAKLSGVRLQGANLSHAEFRGADLTGALLQGADLSSAQLQGTDLTSAQLQGADLTGAKLQGANLSHAQLQDAQVNEASTWRTNVADVDCRGSASDL